MHKVYASSVLAIALSVGFLCLVGAQLSAQQAAPRVSPKPESHVPQQPSAQPPQPSQPVAVPQGQATTLINPVSIVFEKALVAGLGGNLDVAVGSGNKTGFLIYRRGDGKYRVSIDWLIKDIPDAARQQIYGCPSLPACYRLQLNGGDRALQIDYPGVAKLAVRTTFDVSEAQWPIKVQLQMGPPPAKSAGKQPNYPYISHLIEISAAYKKDFFEENLYPTFKHARCTTCHSMGSSEAIYAQHKKNTIAGPIGFPNLKPDDTNSGCSGCHFDIRQAGMTDGGAATVLGQLGTFTDYEWKTPAFAKNINWATKVDARDVCTTVVGHLKTKDLLHHHFFNDARLAWAVSAEDVHFPAAGNQSPIQQKESAPPGNFKKFTSLVDKWLELGFPCKP
jgi:hypothetical protein